MTTGSIGIIMLDTRFPRPCGDIGNADSFGGPVLYRRVAGASAEQAVRGDVDALLAPFIAAGRSLVAEGAAVIGTSCGFLSLFQQDLEAALGVPVVASSLALVAGLDAPGIITIDAAALSPRHLRAAGVGSDVPIVGLSRDGALATTIFEDRLTLDQAAAEAEVVTAAQALIAAHPHVQNAVFECTNLGPYRDAVTAATGLAVYTIVDALERVALTLNRKPH
jgi:hypothetical protein